MVYRAAKEVASYARHPLGLDHDRLLFNFLRISPSYALICRTGGQRITRNTPESSKRIIQAFRKYGDVYRVPYELWSGSDLAMSGKTTSTQQTLLIKPGQAIPCPEGYEGFLIPSYLNKREKLCAVKHILDMQLPNTDQAVKGVIRPKTLWKALAAVYARAKHPDIELWRIGLLANLVERFTNSLDPWCNRKLAKDAEMRRHLTLMTVRALFAALLVAENAARGFFPARTPVPGEQLEFAFAEHRLYALLTAQGDAEHATVLDRAFRQLK